MKKFTVINIIPRRRDGIMLRKKQDDYDRGNKKKILEINIMAK